METPTAIDQSTRNGQATLQVIRGDSAIELSKLQSESVDLVVTSPPYDNLRTYEGHSWNFEATAMQLYRVIKSGGVVCWNIGDSVIDGSESLTSCGQKFFFREQCGFRIHDTMIYEKSNFSHPEKNRYHQVFEYVFVLSKDSPRTFNPICDKRNVRSGCVGNFGVNTFTKRDGSKSVREKKMTTEFGMRGNVWRGKTAGQEKVCEEMDHPAQMPHWLAHDLILSWSNAGDIVLDPFAGSGTTGREALQLGRSAILIEVANKYIPIIHQRCNVTPGLALA